jgi:hypothetical protein
MKVPDEIRCIAINLRGTQCNFKRRIENLCIQHYQKKQRYKVETIRI